jgi:hypothetical protein
MARFFELWRGGRSVMPNATVTQKSRRKNISLRLRLRLVAATKKPSAGKQQIPGGEEFMTSLVT